MFDLNSITTGVTDDAPIITIYGPEGVGKSTFGSMAPNPIGVPTENGLRNIDVAKFPVSKSWEEFTSVLNVLATGKHEYRTAFFDSLDWLEKLIHQKVAKDNNKNSIEEIGYGKGYKFAIDYWQQFVETLQYLVKERNMMVINIAHAAISRFNDPESESYDTYKIKLHDGAESLIKEMSDMVLFVNYKKALKIQDTGFNQKRNIAAGDLGRAIYTVKRPAFFAKNRYKLPPEIPFTEDGAHWGIIAEKVKYLNV